MALIGSCCGRATAEAEKLPLRVPIEMAEDIQKNTRLSPKEIQGLYNSYTGTGECLDDYRYNFATRSEPGEEPTRSPSRHALSEPGLSDIDSPDTADDEHLLNGWLSGATGQDVARGTAQNFSLENNGRLVMSSSRLVLHLPEDASWFERNRDVIYADSLGLHEFLDLVRCLQESRRALLGGEGLVAPDDEIAMVFLPLASEMPDGSRRMMLKDFKQAVRKSPRFLCVLGVASTDVSSPSLHSGKQELERLAAGLRAVEKDMEAVKAALAWDTFGKSSRISSGTALYIHSARLKSISSERAGCLCARNSPVHSGATPELSTIDEVGGSLLTREMQGHVASSGGELFDVAGEMPGDTRPKKSGPTNGHPECLARCAMSAEAPPASAAAAAATVAAAAAVTALKQAEQQLNRILEESTLTAYQPLHIVDQLLMGMGGTCCVEAPHQDLLREGADLREQPFLVRKSIVRSRPIASHGRNVEAEGDCVAEASSAVASGSCRHQKVSFALGDHAQEFEKTTSARDAGKLALKHS
ncbi:hypothetical protein ACSSS7_003539 [Eimeria intestinalis]